MADGKIEIETGIDQSGIKDGLKKVNSILSDAEKYYKSLGKEGAASFAKITAQMKKVDAETAITGNTTSGLAKKQKILKTEIEKLISSGLKPENLKVKSLQKAYDELNTVQTKTVEQKTSIKQTFASMRDVMQGPVAAAVLLKGGLDKVKATIDELTEAYKTQIKAETQLETAAKNNPYLDDASVQSLKEYASEIQSYSTYGDEELLPMMAKLAAAGRTQDEIFAIMTTATDMAASGAFSLDSAVSNLNKSYGGLSGELGESIPEIKDLTSEQLKNGAAVELLAGRYKGIAAGVAKTTGTAEQLANSMGDLKEELGAPFEKGLGPVRTFFKEIIDGWTNSLKAKREYEESKEANESGNSTLTTLQKQLNEEQKILESKKNQLVNIRETLSKSDAELLNLRTSRAAYESLETTAKNNVAAQSAKVRGLEEEIQKQTEITTKAKEKADAEAEAAEAVATANQRNQDAIDIINANTAAREEALATLQATADATGKTVDIQDKLNAYVQSYVSLVTTNPDLVSDTNSASLALLETTKAIAEEAKKSVESTEELPEALDDATDAGIDFADTLKTAINSVLSSFSDLGEELANNDLEWKDLGTTALNTLSSIMSAMAAQLEGYAAEALVKSLLSTLAPELAIPIALAGSAALYAASGFASAKAEGFATGGVIGGTSYTGDTLLAAVNSKERVLTPEQNATFEKLVYDGAGVSGGLSTSNISAIAEAVAGMYNQSVNTNVYLDKRVMAKAITTVQKNGDF